MKRATLALFASMVFASASGSVSAQGVGYAMPMPPAGAHPGGVYNPASMPMPMPMPMPAPGAYPGGVYNPVPVALPPQAYPGGPAGLPPMQGLSYTHADREAWLADCRSRYDGKGRETGGIIGGLLGAIGGGIFGHEVTKGSRTRRLGGTLIGAGVGGLAGMALGAVIGGAGDDRELDECEAYLRDYQGGYGYGGHMGYGYAGYATIMVPMQVQAAPSYAAPVRHETSEVTEEVIEEVVTYPQTTKYYKTAPAVKYVKTAPARQEVKGKTVRYAK